MDHLRKSRRRKIPEEISYNFDIRPILSDKCLACHGPDANKREAGLAIGCLQKVPLKR